MVSFVKQSLVVLSFKIVHIRPMTITHQTVIGDNGKPSAVIIPWDVFEKVRDMLEGEPTPEEAEAMNEAEADRLNGNTDAFTDLEDLKAEQSL